MDGNDLTSHPAYHLALKHAYEKAKQAADPESRDDEPTHYNRHSPHVKIAMAILSQSLLTALEAAQRRCVTHGWRFDRDGQLIGRGHFKSCAPDNKRR